MNSSSSGGRIRLPTWVVRIRSVLRFIVERHIAMIVAAGATSPVPGAQCSNADTRTAAHVGAAAHPLLWRIRDALVLRDDAVKGRLLGSRAMAAGKRGILDVELL